MFRTKDLKYRDTLFFIIPFSIYSVFTSFLYHFLISFGFRFLRFISGFILLSFFILTYREDLSADNANIYLLTRQRTIACII